MSDASQRGLALTAYFTAAVRARESQRPDALFIDPWAARLAGPEGFATLERFDPLASLWPVVRTRYLDDVIRRYVTVTPMGQVVLLAAGLDTRAYRLTWPDGVCVFEVDQPEIMTYKALVLDEMHATPRCALISLAADLRRPWTDRFLATGFDRTRPALWIAEGFFMYLDDELGPRTLRELTQLAAPGSWLTLDLPSRNVRGWEVDDPAMWLATFRWDVQKQHETAAAGH